MKKALLFVLFFACVNFVQAQFGIWGSGVQLDSNSITKFYATSPANPDPNAIGTSNFQGTDLGLFAQNSGSLILSGAQIKTFKNTNGNVCSGDLFYSVYPVGNRPVSITYTDIQLGFYDNCNAGAFSTGGACNTDDQKWQTVGLTNDLTANTPGTYTLELYYRANGTNDGNCNDAAIYDNNNNNATNYTATFTITVVTPVVLQSFTATTYSNQVVLKWADAQEIDVTGFDIERSTDGKIYTTIGWQPAKGAAANYLYTDNNLPNINEVLYRLKIVNTDGSFKYSYVVPVNLSALATTLTLQLSSNNLTVNTKELKNGVYALQLYSVDGKLIMNKAITVAAANSTNQLVSLAGINLPDGVYAVVLRDVMGKIVAKNTVMKN